MKNSEKRKRISALMTMLSALILTFLMVPAYAQQEVSPDWFNPWAAPVSSAAQPVKQVMKTQKAPRNLKAASAESAHRVRRDQKLRAKKASGRATVS